MGRRRREERPARFGVVRGLAHGVPRGSPPLDPPPWSSLPEFDGWGSPGSDGEPRARAARDGFVWRASVGEVLLIVCRGRGGSRVHRRSPDVCHVPLPRSILGLDFAEHQCHRHHLTWRGLRPVLLGPGLPPAFVRFSALRGGLRPFVDGAHACLIFRTNLAQGSLLIRGDPFPRAARRKTRRCFFSCDRLAR